MPDPTTKPAMGQKRPPRSAGRRRLDAPEAILSEDRRSQIRRAQKTYRLKKEASLQQSQKQVAFLEHKMQKITESLVHYRVTLQSSLSDTHCDLLKHFDNILSLLASSEDFVQGTSVDDISLRETSKKSTPQPLMDIQCDDRFPNDTMSDHQVIVEPSSTCTDRFPATAVDQYQETGERDICRSPRVIQEHIGLDHDHPVVQIIDQFGGANVPDSYSFLETSFTRRLKRSSLEHAFRIFNDTRSDPLEVFRVFRLVPCFRDRAKMHPYFRDLVSSGRGSSLEISTLPFYCIGGAGTHYATKDEKGNPIYPPKMRLPRRILGTLPMPGTLGDSNSVHQTQSNLQLCGFGGQWFDCRDVEGYLREQGVDLEGSGLFPTVNNLAPSLSQSELESGFLSTQRTSFSDPQTEQTLQVSVDRMSDVNGLLCTLWSKHRLTIAIAFISYIALVAILRYRRMANIEAPFAPGKKALSEMTGKEAHAILSQLQELEFPHAFAKARKLALLKAGGIPTMSKLFAVTGQNNKRNSGKRAVDTEILLREVQSKPRNSDRYSSAVARMNFLHARYRRANKITDNDLLHTLGDGLAEILNVVDREEWRKLTDVEKCALGIFHKNLGEDMGIPFDVLPSKADGWKDGLQFAIELRDWTIQYEEEVAKPTVTNDQYVRVYVDSALSSLPGFIRTSVRKMLGNDLDDVMRTSLCLESPGPVLWFLLALIREGRKVFLRYLALPRSSSIKLVDEMPNQETRLYNFQRKTLQPWYVKPAFSSKWGLGAMLVRALGGKVPGSRGDRYQPGGYDLMTIGPDPQKEHGAEEMKSDIEVIKARGVVTCPFSQAKANPGHFQ
ncbi:hypothetical protein N7447_001349 [Penicillium robsamsonii]|uniref:uncharacterized protein n=1 Tax=Penicillium robsamsonii TaxID=1792511 RepID=UPI00254938B1|nr:uncharacterized protein N7447_001349 [Penicillium robsamsonii]KAJ5835323.1 hypothetical protein N7447_001349 [Penicillium robsamsonii]